METVKKAGDLGSAISVWGKILIGLFVFVVSIGTAWYQIQTNASDNVRQDGQFKQVLETMTNEFEVWGQRSDKRNKRGAEEDEKLHEEDDHLHDEIDQLREDNLDLVKEIWYIKGKLDEQDKH
jgi:hypothetical protein